MDATVANALHFHSASGIAEARHFECLDTLPLRETSVLDIKKLFHVRVRHPLWVWLAVHERLEEPVVDTL